MAFKLADIFVDLTLKDDKFNAKTKEAKKNVQSMEADISKAIGGISAIGLAVGAVMAKALKDFADAEETLSKFEAVFKEQAVSAGMFADDLADGTRRSRIEIRDMMSTLQDTFVPMGIARDEAAALSKQMTALAIDVASFNNKADADVARDFQSALVGNVETVRKYGIVINEARMNQELLRMGTGRNNRTATEQMKIQARLNLIMSGNKDAMGDAEKTAGSLTNTLKGMAAAVHDLSVTFGSILSDDARNALNVMIEMVKVMNEYLEVYKKLKEKMGGYGIFDTAQALTPGGQLEWASRQAMGGYVGFTSGLQGDGVGQALAGGSPAAARALKEIEAASKKTAANTANSPKVAP